MDVLRDADGHRRFVLGPVEAGVMAMIPGALIAVCVWIAIGAFSRLDKLSEDSAKQAGELRAVTVQLTTMNSTLAGVPQLTTQYAELKVRVDQHDEAIKELRATRGLR